jgi:hypothetical protein
MLSNRQIQVPDWWAKDQTWSILAKVFDNVEMRTRAKKEKLKVGNRQLNGFILVINSVFASAE